MVQQLRHTSANVRNIAGLTPFGYTAVTLMTRLFCSTAALALVLVVAARFDMHGDCWSHWERRLAAVPRRRPRRRLKGAPLADRGRRGPSRGVEETGRRRLQRAGGRRRQAHPLPSGRREEVVEAMDCGDRRAPVALRLPHQLPRRLRIRRRPAGGAGRGQRHRLHLRRAGTAARRGPGRRQEALE